MTVEAKHIFEQVFNYLDWPKKANVAPDWRLKVEHRWAEEQWGQAMSKLEQIKPKTKHFTRTLHLYEQAGKRYLAIVREGHDE